MKKSGRIRLGGRQSSGGFLIQEALETDEGASDLVGLSQFRNGVGDRVVIFQAQQRFQFLRIEFIDAYADLPLGAKVVGLNRCQAGIVGRMSGFLVLFCSFHKTLDCRSLLVHSTSCARHVDYPH